MNLPERKNFNLKGALHLLLLPICVAALASAGYAQKTRSIFGGTGRIIKAPVVTRDVVLPEAVPTPIASQSIFDGQAAKNPTCADLNGSNDPRLAHITADFGFKIDRGASTLPGTYPIQDSSTLNTVLQGGAAPDPSNSITVSVTAGGALNWTSMSRLITAVIVKGGNEGANIYPYDPASLGGNPDGFGLVTPAGAISHVVFCLQPLRPSAAMASVSGRVLTTEGRAVSGARITITNAETGAVFMALTNPFGYYTIEGLDVGSFYTATASSKSYTFNNATRVFTLNDSLADIDFVANP